jgi:proteasome lid subunit RPN8/RPN11
MVTPSDDSPWTRDGVEIDAAALAAVERDALLRYENDEEACGYLRGPSDDVLYCDETVPLENLANKLHKLDPETYFRTARTFFAFNEKKFDDAVRSSREAGRPVKVLYHSHLDAGAYFSPTDAAVMSFGEPPSEEGAPAKLGPGPQWPLAFLVVSVVKGATDASPVAKDRRLFTWDGKAFVEAPLRIRSF